MKWVSVKQNLQVRALETELGGREEGQCADPGAEEVGEQD